MPNFHPNARLKLTAIGLCVFAATSAPANAGSFDKSALASLSQNAAFQQFAMDLWPEAKRNGVSRKLFVRAMSGLTPEPKVMELNANQAEFNTPIWEYLAKRVSDARIVNGRDKLKENDKLFRAIERRHGVDRHILTAIWGMETNYGGYMGSMSTVRSLATLAFEGRRKKYGRQQLMAALKILQNGDIPVDRMTGSWAGAMGHTQFIPTTYAAYAVDWNRDGRRDIWNNLGDAVASAANYLSKRGWKRDRPWGWEIKVPRGFDYRKIGRRHARSVARWTKLGIRPARGGNFGNAGAKSWIVLPAGANGPAFLVTDNFKAILAYNNSVAYALGVAHLADRVRGRGPLVAAWPVGNPTLSQDQRRELQTLLRRRGHYSGIISGRVGKQTKAAIISYQRTAGLTPDGYAGRNLLERLRRNR